MRIAKSKYKSNIILKGGLLLSSIIGEDLRTTKDMEKKKKSISLDKQIVQKLFNEIFSININDNISFEIIGINDIRKEDEYGGFQLNILARLEKVKINLFVELTTGDIITPKEIKYKYKSKFEDKEIHIMAYTIETVIAEKFETMISRGIDNTRMKDYYDLFMLIGSDEKTFNDSILVKAIKKTFKSRKINFDINFIKDIFYVFELCRINANQGLTAEIDWNYTSWSRRCRKILIGLVVRGAKTVVVRGKNRILTRNRKKPEMTVPISFSGYTSKPLKDFIYESNKGRDIFFVSSEEDAIEKLSRT